MRRRTLLLLPLALAGGAASVARSRRDAPHDEGAPLDAALTAPAPRDGDRSGRSCSPPGAPRTRPTAAGRALDEVTRLEDVLSEFRPHTEVSRVNAAVGRRARPVAADTWAVLDHSLRYAALSDGAFDPTWAALRPLWDFQARRHARPPVARRRARAAAADRLARRRDGPRRPHRAPRPRRNGHRLRRHREGLRPRPHARDAHRRGRARLRALFRRTGARPRHPQRPRVARRRAAPPRARRAPRRAVAHRRIGLHGRRLRALLRLRRAPLPPRHRPPHGVARRAHRVGHRARPHGPRSRRARHGPLRHAPRPRDGPRPRARRRDDPHVARDAQRDDPRDARRHRGSARPSTPQRRRELLSAGRAPRVAGPRAGSAPATAPSPAPALRRRGGAPSSRAAAAPAPVTPPGPTARASRASPFTVDGDGRIAGDALDEAYASAKRYIDTTELPELSSLLRKPLAA